MRRPGTRRDRDHGGSPAQLPCERFPRRTGSAQRRRPPEPWRRRQVLADRVEVVDGDAALGDAYARRVPAGVVLACGIFGNVEAADIGRTARNLSMLGAPGAAVISARHRRDPNLVRRLRAWFSPSPGSRRWRSTHLTTAVFGHWDLPARHGAPSVPPRLPVLHVRSLNVEVTVPDRIDYEALASRYDADRPGSYGPDPVITGLMARPDARAAPVADVGSGTGSWLISRRDAFPSDRLRLVGIDPSSSMLAEAQRKAAGPAIDFRSGRAEALPLETASTDHPQSHLSFHHFEYKDASLEELTRVARTDVTLRIATLVPELMRGWPVY